MKIIKMFLFSLFVPLITHAQNKILLEDEKNTIQIFKNTVQSVVNITNVQLVRTGWFEAVERPAGTGTGFIWDNQGHIVTNYHVIDNGKSFYVTFNKDPKQYEAKVIGSAPEYDIAVLKIKEKSLSVKAINIGSSSDLQVGQKTVAIGSPFGLDHTLTRGVVSALERNVDGIGGVKINGMIQTDASINPGNSGGPLLDSQGNIIGMNTVIFSNSGSSAGIGFAVPIDTVKRVVPQLIQFGEIIRPGLGIAIVPDYNKENMGIEKGVIIAQTTKNGPAARAGLKGISQDAFGRIFLGDIITAIDDKPVNSMDDIFHALEKYKIGDSVNVKYIRNNKSMSTKLTLSKIK